MPENNPQVVKRIRATTSVGLKTRTGFSKSFKEGDEETVIFQDMTEYTSHMQSGFFVPVLGAEAPAEMVQPPPPEVEQGSETTVNEETELTDQQPAPEVPTEDEPAPEEPAPDEPAPEEPAPKAFLEDEFGRHRLTKNGKKQYLCPLCNTQRKKENTFCRKCTENSDLS